MEPFVKSIKFFLTLISTSLFFSCQETVTETITGPINNIAQYSIDSLLVPDSVALHDTLKIGLGMFLDCTNSITRIDTIYKSLDLTIAVFGTIFIGPDPRPLCPAVFEKISLLLNTNQRGTLKISALQPSGQSIVDTVIVY